MRELIRMAMVDHESFVVEMDYTDVSGQRTRRVVSPIRWVEGDRVLALCLCREEPRQFYLNRIANLVLRPAEEVLMPVEIKK